MGRVSREALEGLRYKYAEMLAMRAADGSEPADEPRVQARMARLSSRFPGALREIDDLELSEIRLRIAAIDVVLLDRAEAESWMEAVALFHALARGALCAKRWLAKRKRVDAEMERAYVAASAALAFPEDARRWCADLPRIASPPRGRLLDVIFARLAEELGVSERVARALVFGLPRRERARPSR